MVLFRKIRVDLIGQVLKRMQIPRPITCVGAGSVKGFGTMIANYGHKKVLIVTDKMLVELGTLESLFNGLKNHSVDYVVYDGVLPNPTYGMIKDATELYLKNNCDGIIAFGGGSSIDCAKIATAAATHPDKDPQDFIGFFKVKNQPAKLYVVVTTAGTGSEVTIGAVISNDETHIKDIIADRKLVPLVAVMDGEVMAGLPQDITAATGFDALTHTVEAYVSRHCYPETQEFARIGAKLILNNLKTAYEDGKNLKARDAMALGSHYGGLAINRELSGYVHNFGHQFTACYNTPHGLAMGVLLPHVMDFHRFAMQKKLAELAIYCNLGTEKDGDALLTDKFVNRLFELQKEVGIPDKLSELKKKDYDFIIKEAFRECDSSFPVPKYMTKREGVQLLDRVFVA